MSELLRPMLATPFNEHLFQKVLESDGFWLIQPKIDGMRMTIQNGQPISRSGKVFPQLYVQQWAKNFNIPVAKGYIPDGELVAGHGLSSDAFNKSQSGLRAAWGSPSFTYYIFDVMAPLPYQERYRMMFEAYGHLDDFVMEPGKACPIRTQDGLDPQHIVLPENRLPYQAKVRLCPTERVESLEECTAYTTDFRAQGFEGAILRRPSSIYKNGRASPTQAELVKIKDFVDAEGVIVGYEALMRNNNPALLSPLGFTERAKHQEHLEADELLGSIKVRPIEGGEEFKIGVFLGFTHEDRRRLWATRDALLGRIVKFSHQAHGGGYKKPRVPVMLGFREPYDVDSEEAVNG